MVYTYGRMAEAAMETVQNAQSAVASTASRVRNAINYVKGMKCHDH